MTKRPKRQSANGVRSRGPAVGSRTQLEAYLLSREILRRIQRKATQFSEVSGEILAAGSRLH